MIRNTLLKINTLRAKKKKDAKKKKSLLEALKNKDARRRRAKGYLVIFFLELV